MVPGFPVVNKMRCSFVEYEDIGRYLAALFFSYHFIANICVVVYTVRTILEAFVVSLVQWHFSWIEIKWMRFCLQEGLSFKASIIVKRSASNKLPFGVAGVIIETLSVTLSQDLAVEANGVTVLLEPRQQISHDEYVADSRQDFPLPDSSEYDKSKEIIQFCRYFLNATWITIEDIKVLMLCHSNSDGVVLAELKIDSMDLEHEHGVIMDFIFRGTYLNIWRINRPICVHEEHELLSIMTCLQEEPDCTVLGRGMQNQELHLLVKFDPELQSEVEITVNVAPLVFFLPLEQIHTLLSLVKEADKCAFQGTSSMCQFRISCESISVIVAHDDERQNINNESRFFEALRKNSERKTVSSLYSSDHLRLMISGLILEKPKEGNLSCTLSDMEIVDCLYTSESGTKFEDSFKEVVIFKKQRHNGSESKYNEPCVKISHQRTRCATPIGNFKQSLNLHMHPFMSEIDMHVISRIQHLIVRFCEAKKLKDNYGGVSEQMIKLNVYCPSMSINFRFPEPARHAITVIVELSSISLATMFGGGQLEQIEVQYNNLRGLLLKSPEKEPVPFIQVSANPDVDQFEKDHHFEWPRVVISYLCHSKSLLEEQPEDSVFLPHWSRSEPSLFSNTSFCGNTTLPSEGAPDKENGCYETEIIMPSNKEKIDEFINDAISKSQYVVKFDLPVTTLIAEDKHFLQLVYHSFKDMAKWRQVSAIPATDSDLEDLECFSSNVLLLNGSFETPKEPGYPETLEAHISDYSDDETVYSLLDTRKLNEEEVNTGLSIIANIQKGAVVVQSTSRDDFENVSTVTGSRMVLKVEDCMFFTAPSYRGNKDESNLCASSSKVAVYHGGSTNISEGFSGFEALTDGLQPVLYNSDFGTETDILSVSVKMSTDQNQIKNLKVAANFQGATLRHSPNVTKSCLALLVDLASMESDEDASASITGLHLHFEHCAIDYRPLNLPLHAILTVKSLHLSKTLASVTAPSRQIIADEVCLYLSDSTVMDFVDLRNYVCVADTGLFETSIYTASSSDLGKPEVKILTSGDIFHVRTCVDSCKALLHLVTYVANNGDFAAESSCSDDQASCLNRELAVNNTQDIKRLVEEAMEEYPLAVNNTQDIKRLVEEAMEEYPLAVNNTSQEDIRRLVEEAMEEYPVASDSSKQSQTEDNELMGFTEINLGISEEFYNSIEDTDELLKSFPTEDVLKAPDNFPAVLHYFLSQFSIIWKIYGGSDFHDQDIDDKESSLNNSTSSIGGPDEMVRGIKDSSTPVDNDKSCSESFFSSWDESMSESWKQRGGMNRRENCTVELHLKKMQFQLETYPDGEYASRNVLAIRDCEILDRLANSDINKFLYSYQQHGHGLVVKALCYQHGGHYGPEYSVEVSGKSFKLNIDQDTLMFISSFMTKLFNSEEKTPVQALSESLENQIFLRSFTFSEDVVVHLDYTGKRVLFDKGVLAGIVMGLAELSGSEIKLKRLSYNRGLLGYKKLLHFCLDYWMEDIRKNQLTGLLCGIGPADPVIRLFSGIKDLIWLPIKEVHQDGNIITGLKKGAASFLTTSPAAALELTSKAFRITEPFRNAPSSVKFWLKVSQFFVPQGLQDTAVIACDMITPGPRPGNQRKRACHASDIRDGAGTAWKAVKEGLYNNAKSVIEVAVEEHKHKGVHAAVGSVIREIPPAVVNSGICVVEASQVLLDTARNHLSPATHKEMMNKYK